MPRANQDIKEALEKSGVRQWELADRFGFSESGFCKRLRKELPSEEKFKLFSLIAQIMEEKARCKA